MAYTQEQMAFICRNHRIVNLTYADNLLHCMGLRSAVDKARAMARVEPDHVHQGNRYWLTGDIIDAGQAQLAAREYA